MRPVQFFCLPQERRADFLGAEGDDGADIFDGDRKEIVSDGMMLGAVQVPPNGLPIVMLADCATTGGYPKIATVIAKDVPRLAQLLPGESVRFRAVSLEEARKIYLA